MKDLYGKDGDMNKPPNRTISDFKHLLLVKFSNVGSISTFICDEAHNIRSRRTLYNASMLLAKSAKAVIGLTATPFYTGPKVSLTFMGVSRMIVMGCGARISLPLASCCKYLVVILRMQTPWMQRYQVDAHVLVT